MGKPPISDGAMRRMFSAMERLHSVRRDSATWNGIAREDKVFALAEPESLLAAVLSQMHRRDTLVTAGTHPLLNAAVAHFFPVSVASLHTVQCEAKDEETAAVAAGIALKSMDGAKEPKPVITVLLRSFPSLTGAIRLIKLHDLPLIVVAQSEPEPRTITERRVRTTPVPVLPVDGADAVAVCRVMQESLLKARNGWGGAIVHAVRMPGQPNAVAEMRKRMQARDLLPT